MENVTVGANESWDLSKLVNLQVLRRDSLSRLSLDDLELDIVCFCNCADSSASWVALKKR